MTAPGQRQDAAEEIHRWFRRVTQLAEESLFGIVPDGPHRSVVVKDVLARNARILVDSAMDDLGVLYSPLCFLLAAATRMLGTSLTQGHWRSAMDNVIGLRDQMATTRTESAAVGLVIGSPAVLFKQELDEALLQAGFASNPTYPNRGNREIALGLAVNWGIRFLLAYALDCAPHIASVDPDRKDLAWLASQLQSP